MENYLIQQIVLSKTEVIEGKFQKLLDLFKQIQAKEPNNSKSFLLSKVIGDSYLFYFPESIFVKYGREFEQFCPQRSIGLPSQPYGVESGENNLQFWRKVLNWDNPEF
jgi:hypothetical protein